MTQYYFDFQSDSTGDIDASPDWARQATPSGGWTYAIVDNAGDKEFQINESGWGNEGLLVHNVTAGATTGDIEVVCRLRIGTAASLASDWPVVASLIATANDQSYALGYRGTGDWQIQLFGDGIVDSGVGSTVADLYTPADNTKFWIRLGRNGTTIRAKVWGDGSAEPGSWQLSGTSTTITNCRGGTTTRLAGPDPYTIDVFGIGTGGDSAPTSAFANATGSATGAAGTSAAGTILAVPRPPPPYTLTTVTG